MTPVDPGLVTCDVAWPGIDRGPHTHTGGHQTSGRPGLISGPDDRSNIGHTYGLVYQKITN